MNIRLSLHTVFFVANLAFQAPVGAMNTAIIKALCKSDQGCNIEAAQFHEASFNTKWQTAFAHTDLLSATEMAKRFISTMQGNRIVQELLGGSPFRLGLSSSAYQYEGDIGDEDVMHDFYSKRNIPLPGKAIDFWNNYQQIIDEIATCGINTFRMSISWSRVEPEFGQFDYKALQHYHQIIEYLLSKGITPIIVLHHYTHPTWFQTLGGFEKMQNVRYFVRYAQEVYKALADVTVYWSTFNAIEGFAFKGYFTLQGPPSKPGNFFQRLQTVSLVMANMLEAHVQVYEAIKGITGKSTGLYQKLKEINPSICEPQIGIQKNILPIDPATDSILSYYIGRIRSAIGNKLQNEGFYNFFATGTFSVIGKIFAQHTNKNAPFALDWIGVNTYSNRYEGLGKIEEADEFKTENENYRFYPECLDRAVRQIYERVVEPRNKRTNRLLPIWIVENGIATKHDITGNKKRELFFKRALTVITSLIEEGFPIVAYTPWASHDNYEWGSSFGQKRYGMFFVDSNDIYAPHPLKDGSRYFINFVKSVLDTQPTK